MIKVYKLGAEWCGPCRMMKPAIAALMEKYNVEGSTVEVVDVDIDKDPELAQAHGVRTIPTMLFMVGDEVAKKHSGVMAASDIEAVIKELNQNNAN